MFEHMKNYKDLLKKISKWMKTDGFLFVEYFCHKTYAYHFEDVDEDDWITRYFFSGGTMPSANLILYFQDDISVVNHWLVNGKHYAQTMYRMIVAAFIQLFPIKFVGNYSIFIYDLLIYQANSNLMDKSTKAVQSLMESTYGKDSPAKWMVYWRTYFMSIAELFGYNDGEEWMVALCLFKRK
ncbi:putative S-adenosyl-L-methionine-dependent methyltransferase [Helianthus annuus]|uniref:S-adenosyl-L-methionine-dependent methyltransferase n=1 Tax=Helianthus annuus TaxID=4232 RepID=A0A9K3HSJ7_HELAN|nr:putative S-adenosyl-L-methionine-dependent methyltransferase [Helianthus annuus]KAJ0502914.1 putative S-adenosyl-L-methionine-dependent methyltransferase [Helianthus annuus]KAJ0518879.1 putative S-adenosyl-L-methionine-dependent methyltransferase [Helianthus annuus]